MLTKKDIPVICRIVSAVFLILFIVKSIADYIHYSPGDNSAPYSVWLLANAFFFIIPAVIVFVFGIIIKKRHSGD